jgi:uncharacterized protein (TIGR00299 family) protein
MRILYIDLQNSGISGDMLLAALLGLVKNHVKILKQLKELENFLPDVSKLEINLDKEEINGVQVNKLNIDIKESKDHRTAKLLQNSLDKYLVSSNLSESAMKYAQNVLNSLIIAESEVHGKLTDNIHLHELSSIDTLIDIVGVTTTFDDIKAFNEDIKIYCSKIPLGGGKIVTKHGILPVPAPATIKILEKSDLISYGGPIDSELVTPTGVALLVNLNPEVLRYPSEMKIIRSIYSTGQNKFKNFLNILRLFYGDSKEINNFESQHTLQKYTEKVSILETDVDDVSGEILGNFISNLKKEEFLDIQIFPTITKKNRPGHKLEILCYPEQTFRLIEKIIREIGTLGVRYNIINRVCISRRFEKKTIKINEKSYIINYKISYFESDKKMKIVNIKPEYEDLEMISKKTNLTIKKVQLIAQSKIKEIYENFNSIN